MDVLEQLSPVSLILASKLLPGRGRAGVLSIMRIWASKQLSLGFSCKRLRIQISPVHLSPSSPDWTPFTPLICVCACRGLLVDGRKRTLY